MQAEFGGFHRLPIPQAVRSQASNIFLVGQCSVLGSRDSTTVRRRAFL
jgi:hypothetical protein